MALPVKDTGTFSQTFCLESLDLFSESSSKIHISSSPSNLYNLNLFVKLMVLLHQIWLFLAITAIAETILLRISVQQVPSLDGVALRDLKPVTASGFWPLHVNIRTDAARVVGHHSALFALTSIA